jgi:hypothetical protein
MWLFTKHGFFSAVCARKGKGRHGQPIDPDRIMVRARLRSHLKALKERFPNLLGGCEILETAGTDYAFRLFVPKSAWVPAAMRGVRGHALRAGCGHLRQLRQRRMDGGEHHLVESTCA